MPDSNEPREKDGGKQVFIPASPEIEDIPLADVDAPDEPKPDPIAPDARPPAPPDQPIDEGDIAPDVP